MARAGFGALELVSGSGPIGCRTLLAAQLTGAAEIVVTDISDPPLAVARNSFRFGAEFFMPPT